MKFYIHIFSLIGNIISLIYNYYRLGIMIVIMPPTIGTLSNKLYILIPFGFSVMGITIGILFLFSQRFLKLFNILMSLAAINTGFLTIEFLFHILPSATFAFDYITCLLAMSQIICFILISITIIGANNKT